MKGCDKFKIKKLLQVFKSIVKVHTYYKQTVHTHLYAENNITITLSNIDGMVLFALFL
jgi:hypothetical protein